MKRVMEWLNLLHRHAGIRLYINLLAMVFVGFVNGLGLLLLIPMLSLIGIPGIQTENIPIISSILQWMHEHSVIVNLPVILVFYFLLTLGQSLIQREQAMLDARIQLGFSRYLRDRTYQALLSSNWSFFLRRRKSDFNHILTTELGRVAQGTNLILTLISAAVFTCVQIAIAFMASATLTTFVLVSSIVLIFFSRKGVRKAKGIGGQTTDLWQNYYAGVTDQLNGIKDLKSNMLEQTHMSWFRSLSAEMERNSLRFKKLQMNTQLIYNSVSALLIVGFIFISRMVFKAEIEQLILIVLIFTRLWPRVISLQNNVQQLVSTFPAFQSLMTLQRECEEAQEQLPEMKTPAPRALQLVNGVACKDISFRYDPKQPEYALQQINLLIPARRTTAVVGRSGAGKSTLIDIIIGLLTPEQGQILVDGMLVTEENRLDLKRAISYVPQEPFLFNTSLRDNLILMKPDATEAQMWEALRFAVADDFVRKLPSGLDTIVGDRGTRLSGGERQRIVLARAILKQPAILVLDEATSALDNENEARIQEALDRLKGTLTIIVIAHRLSTIRHADQVIVLEAGRIVQQGDYQQLSSEPKGKFRRMLDEQPRVGAAVDETAQTLI